MKEVEPASPLDEDRGRASLGGFWSGNAQFLGLEHIGARGSVWTARVLHSFAGSSAWDLQGKVTPRETKDFTNSS